MQCKCETCVLLNNELARVTREHADACLEIDKLYADIADLRIAYDDLLKRVDAVDTAIFELIDTITAIAQSNAITATQNVASVQPIEQTNSALKWFFVGNGMRKPEKPN